MSELLPRLIECGLEEDDARVYLTLARMGLCRVSDLARALRTSRMNAYRKLKKLQDEGLVTAALGKPIRFEVVPIEDVLDKINKNLKERLSKVESNRAMLTREFKILTPVEPTAPKFQICEGRSAVYDLIVKLCESARKEIRIIATGREIARLALIGLDDILKEASGRVDVRILTEVEESNIHSLEEAMEYAQLRHNTKLPHQRTVIVDDGSVLSSMMLADSGFGENDIALWTDAQDYVGTMTSFFDQIWEDSLDCKAAIQALKSGAPLQQVKVISGLEAYTELATKMMTQAKSSIIVSCESLTPQLLPLELLREMSDRGVQVRVLMSITQKTLKNATEMLSFAKVRSLGTPLGIDILLVDGVEILQRFAIDLQTGAQAVWSNVPSYVRNSAELVEHAWERAVEAANVISELEAEKTLLDGLEGVRQRLEENGFLVEMPGIVRGESGALHRFDLIAKSPESQDILLVADVIKMAPQITTKIIHLYAKCIDVHQEAKFLFTAVDPDKHQLRLAKSYSIQVVAGSDKKQLTSKFQGKIREIIGKSSMKNPHVYA